MVLNGTPTIHYEGRVVGGGSGYSSLLAELARGRTFSAQVSPAQLLRAGHAPRAQAPQPAPPAAPSCAPPDPPDAQAVSPPAPVLPEPAPHLPPAGLRAGAVSRPALCPTRALPAPGGIAAGARGTLSLLAAAQGGLELHLAVQGLRSLAPQQAIYALWLLHDLAVSPDLPPEDLALLPRGPLGVGNAPGTLFTLDGQPPAQGQAANTLTVAVQAGTFTPGADTAWEGRFTCRDATGWTLNPVVLLGPAAVHLGPGVLQPVPSGVARSILADVFLHRASRFVSLPLHSAFPQRLLTAAQEAIAAWDTDGSGHISAADVVACGRPGAFIEPLEFGRAVVTLEPIAGRTTSLLLPTTQACALAGSIAPC